MVLKYVNSKLAEERNWNVEKKWIQMGKKQYGKYKLENTVLK